MLLAIVLLGALVAAPLVLSSPAPRRVPVRLRPASALSRIGRKR